MDSTPRKSADQLQGRIRPFAPSFNRQVKGHLYSEVSLDPSSSPLRRKCREANKQATSRANVLDTVRRETYIESLQKKK